MSIYKTLGGMVVNPPKYVTKPCPECTLTRPIPTVGIEACDECAQRMRAAMKAIQCPHGKPMAASFLVGQPCEECSAERMKLLNWVGPWVDPPQTVPWRRRTQRSSTVTIPGRGSAIVTYGNDGVTSVEVVDGRGVQFTEPQS